ncbi:hypothetical protein GJ496_010056 [Pomphorhynchus laevis]|nr:hypothetical protein GJ496_010056 [Pomphorhynchus laevis]
MLEESSECTADDNGECTTVPCVQTSTGIVSCCDERVNVADSAEKPNPLVMLNNLALLNHFSQITSKIRELKRSHMIDVEQLRQSENAAVILREEGDKLRKEKLVHVEELRAIHADLNLVSLINIVFIFS